MKARNIKVTLNKAREWYNSDNDSLKEVALQAFKEKELKVTFRDVKSFIDACNVLNIDKVNAIDIVEQIKNTSKASAAIFKISIIRKALNFGQDMHLTKDPKNSCIYYPINPFVTNDSTYYSSEINSDIMEVIGKIKSEGIEYNILGDIADTHRGGTGFGRFSYEFGDGGADADVGFLGCANEEIAKHFSKHFGMLITEAKYGDLPDFEIIERKYN